VSAAQQLWLFDSPRADATSPVAPSAPEPAPLCDRLMAALDRQVALAEQQERELKELLAELEGVPVDQLDDHLAKQEAERKAELDRARAARPHPQQKRQRRVDDDEGSGRIGASQLSERQRELLRNIRVENDVAIYTPKERIPDWDLLKRVMLALGGKWRSRKGFAFPDDVDAQELVRLALETGEILDPKKADFFPTPAALADRIVAWADIRPGDRVLEPSAGRGAIALAVRRACPEAHVVCCEALPHFRAELESMGFDLLGRGAPSGPVACEDDFLGVDAANVEPFDVVVMNSPFSGRADLTHVEHALRFLRPGGSAVAIMSAGAKFRDDKRARAFRALVIDQLGGRFEDNPDGSFIESGTGVRTVTLVIPRGAR
jgi:hypothetical protein